MKKVIVSLAILILVIVTIGYFWYSKQLPSGRVQQKGYDVMLTNILQHPVAEISVLNLSNQVEAYTLLDSRTLPEFTTSHIPGAIFIGEDISPKDSATLHSIPIDKPVVVYCSVGLRSERAAEKLKEIGFENVFNLYGGIFEWSNQHKPLENSYGNATDTIHGYNMIWAKWLTAGKIVLE